MFCPYPLWKDRLYLTKEDLVQSMYIREASHAGSWYDGRKSVLKSQMEGWLEVAAQQSDRDQNVKAVIVPHAGYSYSGPTAAYAYNQIDDSTVKRIFVIGPSHHVYTEKMAISAASRVDTPVGNLIVDDAIRNELLATGNFDTMTKDMDEAEHSLEMQLPFIANATNGGNGVTIIPMVTGRMTKSTTKAYATILLPYFLDNESLFVISSDFCHWGRRFHYQPYDREKGKISEYIEWLDKTAVALIEQRNQAGFVEYLRDTQNTICGRDAINLLMVLEDISERDFSNRCLMYSQSSAAQSMSDSSVSYVAAVASCRS